MATIRKRGDGWYVQIRRKGFSPQYRTFRTKAEGEAWAREQDRLIDQGKVPQDLRALRTITLGDVLRRYVQEVTPTKRSAESEAARLGKMLRAPMCDLSLSDLRPAAIAAYRDVRLAVAMPGTVRRELTLLRRALDVARAEWGYSLGSNPARGAALPIVRNARERRLEDGEVARLKQALNGTRNRLVGPLIIFALETALRRGELLRVQWRHVDLKRRTVHIPQTKTDTPRTIPLTPRAIEVLSSVPRSHDEVFPITAVALRHAWDRLCARAALSDLHFHDLRHEAVSRFFELGLSVPEVALISGHKDPRMLFRYTHMRAGELAMKLASLHERGRGEAN